MCTSIFEPLFLQETIVGYKFDLEAAQRKRVISPSASSVIWRPKRRRTQYIQPMPETHKPNIINSWFWSEICQRRPRGDTFGQCWSYLGQLPGLPYSERWKMVFFQIGGSLETRVQNSMQNPRSRAGVMRLVTLERKKSALRVVWMLAVGQTRASGFSAWIEPSSRGPSVFSLIDQKF